MKEQPGEFMKGLAGLIEKGLAELQPIYKRGEVIGYRAVLTDAGEHIEIPLEGQ